MLVRRHTWIDTDTGEQTEWFHRMVPPEYVRIFFTGIENFVARSTTLAAR